MNTFQQPEAARDFAYVTHAARDMAEIMQRTFHVRVKGSSDLSWSIPSCKLEQAKLLGKWINVKIDWGITGKYALVLKVEDSPYLIQLTEKEFHHMTQVGDFPKISELYKLYKKTLDKQC